jgi:hypothetical protein
MFYPINAPIYKPPSIYMFSAMPNVLPDKMRMIAKYLKDVKIESVEDAKFNPIGYEEGRTLKLNPIIFSHGYGTKSTDYTSIC